MKPRSSADGGTRGMAQLSVIPGSATAWTGRGQGVAAAGMGEAAPASGPLYLIPGDAGHLQREGLVGPRGSLRARSQSDQRRPSSPVPAPQQVPAQVGSRRREAARRPGSQCRPAPRGGALCRPRPLRAHWLFPVTSRSAIKKAARRSRRWKARGGGRPGSGRRLGRWATGASAMFYSGLLTEGGRKETDMREAASLRQQRRMKQAVQFIHKDSADLLPLDGLKKLGSSKDTVSPPRPRSPRGPRARPVSFARRGLPGPPWPLSLSHRPGPRRPLSCGCRPSDSAPSTTPGFRFARTPSGLLELALPPAQHPPLGSLLPRLPPSGPFLPRIRGTDA